MSDLQPSNEIWVNFLVVQDMLAAGGDPDLWFRVSVGIDPDAQIRGIRLVDRDRFAIVYDRTVSDPVFEQHWHPEEVR